MNNLIAFINTFLSYIVVMAVIVVVAAVACAIGIAWRKAKDAKLAPVDGTDSQATENVEN